MPDTQPCRSHASCPSVLSLLEMLRFSARLAKVHHDNSAPTVLILSQNSLGDTHSLRCFVTGKMVAFELCDQQSSLQTVRACTCACACMHKCVHARVHVCVRAHMHLHVCMHAWVCDRHACACVCACVCKFMWLVYLASLWASIFG